MNSIKPIFALSAGFTAIAWTSPVLAKLADYQTAVTNQPGILSYYTFDQSNASDTLGAHDGTVFGAAAFTQGVGDAGKALKFDGLVRVNLGVVPDFDFADGSGTVEAWVLASWSGVLTYNPALFADRNGGPVNWSVHMNGDKSAVGMWNGVAYRTLPIPNPGTSWHHFAVVFDAGTLTIYWDGASMGTLDQDLGFNPQSTQLGSSSAGVTAEGWVGMMDEVAFYADALSADAVQAHYLALFAGTPPVITSQPRGGTFLPGVALQLKVGATGPNLAFQWFKGSNPISGKTDATLSFPSFASGDADAYHVVVSNPAGSVPSQNVTITVSNSLPTQLVTYQKAITNELSLIAYYTFDRLTAADSLGHYDGTLVGTAGFAEGIGSGPAQALFLDGAGHVNLGAVSDFDFSDGTGTLEAWVRADWSAVGYNPALFADRDGGPVTWSVHMNSDKKAVGMWNGTAYQTRPIASAGNNWHHLVVVFDTGNMTLYWDGTSLGTIAQGLGSPTGSTQLGSSSAASTTEGWIGLLDEVAFYADALSADAVLAHYKAFLGGTPPLITLEPVGGAFYTGRPLQLTVGVTGAELSYKWFKDGNPVPAGTNATLAFPSLAVTDSGVYYLSVSNPAGTTNSVAVAVLVGNNLPGYQKTVTNEPSLISYYTFDADDPSDAKGAHPGIEVNQVAYQQGVGLGTDRALLLDGTGHIGLGQVADFDFANDNGTVEAWLRADWPSDPGYDPCVFANRIASTLAVNWSIHMGRLRNVIGNWNGLFFQTLSPGDTVGWHHYAVAFGAGQVTMFWDGQPLGTFAQPIHLTTGLPTQIGSSDPVNTTEGWVGGIDEVAVYRDTLDADAIAAHFLAMVAPTATVGPTISYLRAGNQLTLSWPPEATGYTLESTDKLPASSWSSVSGVVGNSVTVGTSSGTQFYRLRK